MSMMNLRRLNLNPQQEKCLREMKTFTGASTQQAVGLLQECKWELARAVDEFFARGYMPEPENTGDHVDQALLSSWFSKYSDKEDTDFIYEDGIAQFCSDLGLDPEDPVMLVLSWYMEAATMCVFTREEWVKGLERIGADSVDRLKGKLPELRTQLEDEKSLKEIYMYSFTFAKEPGQKSLSLEVALPLWRILLGTKYPEILEWCRFLEENHTYPISKDTWSQILQFMMAMKEGFEHYDPNGAWPVLIDDFMDWKSRS